MKYVILFALLSFGAPATQAQDSLVLAQIKAAAEQTGPILADTTELLTGAVVPVNRERWELAMSPGQAGYDEMVAITIEVANKAIAYGDFKFLPGWVFLDVGYDSPDPDFIWESADPFAPIGVQTLFTAVEGGSDAEFQTVWFMFRFKGVLR